MDEDEFDEFFEIYDDADGDFNSSLYSTISPEDSSYEDNTFNNTSLKYGIIVECYDINDEKNMNKKAPEYRVKAIEQSGQSSVESKYYQNCISIDGFGGVSDYFEYKLRPIKTDESESPATTAMDFDKQYGNMVLLLCLDGSTDKAIIIKSLPHKTRKTNLTPENELHLQGEYNGINWQINKDGELIVEYKSKTNDKGEPQDETAGGSTITVNKEGSIEFVADDKNYIVIDKPSKTINIEAETNINSTAGDSISQTASKGSITQTAKSDLVMNALSGSASITAKSTIDIKGTGKVSIEGPTVEINGKGTVNIKSKIVQISAPDISLGKGAIPAIVPTTLFLGFGNLGIPVICNAIGPYSSTVKIKP